MLIADHGFVMKVLWRKKPEAGMNLNVMLRGRFALVGIVVILMMVAGSGEADASMTDSDMDMTTHDYIMDKQPLFSSSMVELSEEEMSDTVAAGFSQFSIQDNVVRAQFNISVQTFTEIESLKMGYYDDGTTGLGWDQNWLNVSLGSATTPLVCEGLFLEARFTNISDPTTRTLETLRVGTPSMTGPISADFVSFSGRIASGGVASVEGHRLNLGTRTITSTNSEFYMQLSTVPVEAGQSAGWWFSWDNATITP
jgi:hypothetical protein